jgi:hypothetical protein
MRFVAIKSQACSSVMVLHRTRDFLVRQRTQIGNAIRAHMTEVGIIAATGAQNVDRLKEQLDQLPETARMPVSLLFDQLSEANKRIERLTGDRGNLRAKRDKSASGYDPRCGCTVGYDHRGDDTGCRQLRLRKGLGRLARPHAQTALHRRQAQGGWDLQDGQSIHPALAISRRHGADHAQTSAQARAGIGLAVKHADAQEDEGCRHALAHAWQE